MSVFAFLFVSISTTFKYILFFLALIFVLFPMSTKKVHQKILVKLCLERELELRHTRFVSLCVLFFIGNRL